MAPKKNQNSPFKLSVLVVTLSDARHKLFERLEIGREILSYLQSEEDFDFCKREFNKWHDYNTELLRRIVDTEELSKEYSYWGIATVGDTLVEKTQILKNDLNDYIYRLESIYERLPLLSEKPGIVHESADTAISDGQSKSRDVFVVHGTDHGTKESVARLLSKLNLNPIILHEQPNLGDTIIEKLETNSFVSFAIVLLTSDDQGNSRFETTLNDRARQNVILELGYFLGRLGRKKVCALYSEGVELPSDYDGVVYTLLDKEGAWQLKLAKELKASGLEIDMNSLF